jgi:cytochrome c oxidase subunit 2
MRKKIQFALSIVLVGCAILATRFYLVDLPLWHFVAGGNGLDPATLHLQGEFVESNLGTAEERDNSFTVRMIAQQYLFVPQCIVVPVGVPVRFRITSADAAHMVSFGGTTYNLKAMPGVVNQASFIFREAGRFPLPCHEFCGPGHYTMRAELKVVPRGEFASLRPDERRNCGTR